MAFESIRKFVSVRKSRSKNDAMLSLNVLASGTLKSGEKSYSISLLVHSELISQVGWNEKTKLDVLIDSENQVCMLKPDRAGFTLSFPNKNKDGGYEGVSAYVKFKLPDPFDYIPKESDRIELTIVDCIGDSVIFEMPKITVESHDIISQQKFSVPVNYNRVDRPFSLSLE